MSPKTMFQIFSGRRSSNLTTARGRSTKVWATTKALVKALHAHRVECRVLLGERKRVGLSGASTACFLDYLETGMGERPYLAHFFKLVVDSHRCCPCMALGRQLRLRPPPHNTHIFRQASHLPSKERKRRPQDEGRCGERSTLGDICRPTGLATSTGDGGRGRGLGGYRYILQAEKAQRDEGTPTSTCTITNYVKLYPDMRTTRRGHD